MATENTFKGANTAFANTSIHGILAQVMNFREQLTARLSETQARAGWGDPLNLYMQEELQRIRKTLARITYNIDSKTKDELENEAGDTDAQLKDEFSKLSFTSDQVLMPPPKVRPLVWDLSGASLDLPQLTPENCPNAPFRAFVTLLDEFFVQMTRLDSRHCYTYITKHESSFMNTYLDQMYAITVDFGGENSKADISSGTLPSQESKTFLASGNAK